MPQITQYTRQIIPSDRAVYYKNTQGDEQLENQKLKQDKSDYVRILSDLEVANEKRKVELSNEAYPENSDLSEIYSQDLTKRLDTVKVPDTMKEQFTLDSARMKKEFGIYGIKDQARRIGIRNTQNQEDTLVKAENLIYINPDNYEKAKILLNEQLSTLSDISPEIRDQYKNDAEDRLDSAYANAIISSSPDTFLEEAANGQWNELKNLDRYVEAAKKTKKLFKQEEEKLLKSSREASVFAQVTNESTLSDVVFDENKPIQEKITLINKMDLEGAVSSEWATEARRYLKSQELVDTNAEEMADIISQIYDVNAKSEIDSKEYLIGIKNIKQNIMQKRASGKLSATDEQKLLNQIKTLTSAKTAQATQNIAYSFGDANDLIKNSLPPEYRGQATRELFYMTEGKTNLTDQEYKAKARTIVDIINNGRRTKTIQSIAPKSLEQELEEVDVEELSDVEILNQYGYTKDDIMETMQKRGMTYEQIIEYLRNR